MNAILNHGQLQAMLLLLFCLLSIWRASSSENALPIIDIKDMLGDPDGEHWDVFDAIKQACERTGFFYVRTGISEGLIENLERVSREFFDLPDNEKEKIAMHKSKKAWRGFFKVATELTSGIPDMKEGIYFGKHEKNYTGDMPLRGENQFPSDKFAEFVLEYME